MSRLVHSRWTDPVAGAVLWVLALLEIAASDVQRGPFGAHLATTGAMALGFAIRRRNPIVAAACYLVGGTAQAAWLTLPSELFVPFLGLILIPYAAGGYAGRRAAWLATGGCIGMVLVVAATAADGMVAGDVIFPAGFCLAALAAGRTMRARTRLAAELHEAAVRAEEARTVEAERAVAEERRRIAREMHDVVAHSISVMVVQAGGARRILDREPERAMRAAVEIERAGRDALAEMRRLLGVLQPPDAPAARAPQPGLDGIEALVGRARSAGLPVTVAVDGERRPLPTGLDLTAYRIVQEALTNALKHAGGAPTGVELRWSEDALEILVRDGGRSGRSEADSAASGLEGGGHGLVGMRERVRVYGGELHTGHLRDGGFEVRARLPLQREEVTA